MVLSKSILCKASKNKCIVGKFFQEFFMFLINGEREAVVSNCSCVDALKGTVLHRTVPRDRVNGKPIRTYAEGFHTEPYQSPV